MKNTILLAFIFFIQIATSQELSKNYFKNSLSTSLFRYERNAQAVNSVKSFKFFTALQYERYLNRFRFGVKYENGFNEIMDVCEHCADATFGKSYLKENNFYLTSNYRLFDVSENFTIDVGMALYYSFSNYHGDFSGGFSGSGERVNRNYNATGIMPSVQLNYFLTKNLFISLQSYLRIGKMYAKNNTQQTSVSYMQWVGTYPELKIGTMF